MRRLTDEHGELRYTRLDAMPFTVFLEPPAYPSLEVAVPEVVVRPVVVELPRAAMATVRLELTGAHVVRQVVASWERLDVRAEPLVVERFRNAVDAPFEFRLPVGRYRLELDAPARGERRDTFLVSRQHELDVPADGAAATLALDHGGRLGVVVRDGRGVHVPGTVRLVTDGAEVWTAPARFEPLESPNLRVPEERRSPHGPQ